MSADLLKEAIALIGEYIDGDSGALRQTAHHLDLAERVALASMLVNLDAAWSLRRIAHGR
jgi:hypothetical protein